MQTILRRPEILLLTRTAVLAFVVCVSVSADEKSQLVVTEYEQTPRLLISLLDEPRAAAVSPDGNVLATGHDDGSIVLWNTDTGLPQRTLTGHDGTVAALAFDATGSRLVSGGYDASVRVWNVDVGEIVTVFNGHTSRVTCVALSPDGSRLASGGYDKTVRLWNLAQPDEEPTMLSGHESTVRSVAFSPDGQRLATADDAGMLRLFQLADASEPNSVEASKGPLRSVRFSPDGTSLVCGSDNGGILQWDAVTLERRPFLPEADSQRHHTAPISSLQFTSDGRLLATGDLRGDVKTWETGTGRVTSQLDGHDDEIKALAFRSGGDALLTLSVDRTVNVWRARLPLTPRLASIDDVAARLWTLAVAPDGSTLYAGGRDKLLAAWNLESGEQTTKYEGFDGTIDALALTSDGLHLACCGWKKEDVAVFNTQTGEQVAALSTGTKARCLQFSPDSERLAIGYEDGTLRLWAWQTDDEPQSVQNGALAVYDIAFSPDGKQLVTCSGDWRKPEPGDVTFWNTDGYTESQKLTEHTHAVRAVTFSPDGSRVASAGEDGLVVLWHAETHVPLARLNNGPGVRPVAFSPDGTRLAVGLHDGTINVWDVDRGEVVQRFLTADDVFAVSYSQDGTVLFSVSGEKQIEIWPVDKTVSTAERIKHWSSPPSK